VTANDIARLQAYLQGKFNNNMIKLMRRPKVTDSVEIMVGDETMGVIYRDEEDGEISYSMNICILEEDLPSI